jgi:poly(A) polymerase
MNPMNPMNPSNPISLSIPGFDLAILPNHSRAWMVGGSVRDLLRGIRPTDMDIAVEGHAESYAMDLAAHVAGRMVTLGKAAQTIHRVIAGACFFDVCRLNGSTIEDDLFQRDFSINAMAWPLPAGKLVDCTGGLADLQSKLIRRVSKSSFAADPLRLLRAFRLAATLGFAIEEKTAAAIRSQKHLIRRTAGERIREELTKILTVAHSSPAVDQMASDGLLSEMIPELGLLRDGSASPDRVDALKLGLTTYHRLEWLLGHPRELSSQAAASVLKPPHPQRLKLAALLHGIVLPPPLSGSDPGAMPIDRGVQKTIPAIAVIARRLKLSNAEQADLNRVLAGYNVPGLLLQARQNGRSVASEMVRWYRQSGKLAPAILIFAMAHETRCPLSSDHWQKDFNDFCREMMGRYFDDFVKMENQPHLVSGHDLIDTFGLAPSPIFKTILDAVEQARLVHQMHSRAEAVQWIKGYLRQHGIGHSS